MHSRTIPELLAPAGSPETFQAGFDAGADAFYLGAPDFNARKRAKNFTRDEIEQAAAFAHQHGKRVYITLNTLIYDSEIPGLLDLLVFLDRIRVDAVIVQDLGVLDILRRHFPSLRVHASTQTFCHNSLQAQFLKDAGVSRIILPRELSLDEIRAISAKVPLEYELFIHGALCFSFSGCCLFSSNLYGASGNRGECRQVCRHGFETDAGTRYPFAMKDLNAAPILQKILETRPAALKIEGRLKNADYVSQTVSMYRRLLDAYAETGRVPEPGKMPTGQRVFTTGYFEGKADHHSLVTQETPGVIGEHIGTARIPLRGSVLLKLREPLSKGARLRLTDKRGRVACEGTLLSFSTRTVKGGVEIRWNLSDAEPSAEPLTALLLGTYQPKDPRRSFRHALSHAKTTTLALSLEWAKGRLTVRADAGPGFPALIYSAELPLVPSHSEKEPHALLARMKEMFTETGVLPFTTDIRKMVLPQGMFCPVSALKKIRQQAFAGFDDILRKDRADKETAVRQTVLGELAAYQQAARNEAPAWLETGAMESMPLFVPEAGIPQWKKRINGWADGNGKQSVANAFGWVPLLTAIPAINVYSGPYVYCVNSFAYGFLMKRGLAGCILPSDTDNATLGPLIRYPGVYRQKGVMREMMASRLRIPWENYRLKGKRYRVESCESFDLLVEV
ncbi:MAG: peptidase U32 family protein [Fibrobacterota bacterium]